VPRPELELRARRLPAARLERKLGRQRFDWRQHGGKQLNRWKLDWKLDGEQQLDRQRLEQRRFDDWRL
jgi:hypothetical protein